MNVAGLRWFCTDMDWYAAQYQLRQIQIMQAMNNLQSAQTLYGCHCNNRPAQGGGLFGGLFGGV